MVLLPLPLSPAARRSAGADGQADVVDRVQGAARKRAPILKCWSAGRS